MRRIVRRLLILAGCAAVAIYLAPWIAYWYFLDGVDELPTVKDRVMVQDQIPEAWARFGGEGDVRFDRMSPWTFVIQFSEAAWSGARPVHSHGALVANAYAGQYLGDLKRSGGKVRDWHGCRAALTIWITRNMTAESVLIELDESTYYRRESDT